MIPETRSPLKRLSAKKKAVFSASNLKSTKDVIEGSNVLLHRRTKVGGHLRLMTLSWSLNAEDAWGQSADTFLASIVRATENRRVCDLLIAAGLTVNEIPSERLILKASKGLPVLFEAQRDGRHSWFLAHRKNGNAPTLIRRQQVATSFNSYDRFSPLCEIIASGAGSIEFADTDLKLVLFICGENNVLCTNSRASILKRSPSDDGARSLSAVLSHQWLVLNPAHEPYYPQIRSTGFAKIGVVHSKTGSAGPTLKRLVESRAVFRDGTRSPVAVVHVNNFYGNVPKTAGYVAVAFGDLKDRVRHVESSPLGAMCRTSVFEVQLDRDR